MSQEDCKSVKLTDGTEVNLYDSSNVKEIQQMFIDLDEADSLIGKHQIDIADYLDNINSKEKEINVLELRIKTKENQITEKENQIEILSSENKKNTKKIKLLKKIRNLYAVSGIVVGTLGSYYLSQIF